MVNGGSVLPFDVRRVQQTDGFRTLQRIDLATERIKTAGDGNQKLLELGEGDGGVVRHDVAD